MFIMFIMLITRTLVATLAVLGLSASCAADSITLRTTVRLAPDITSIMLRDVAYLDGDEATRLGTLVLGDLADRPSLEMSLEEIRGKLAAQGVKVALIDWTGNRVVVRNAHADRPRAMQGMTIDDAAIKAAAVPTPPTIAREEFLVDDVRGALTPRGLIADLMSTVHAAHQVPVRLQVEGVDASVLDDNDRSRRYEIVPLTALSTDIVRARIVAREGDIVVSRTDIIVRATLKAQVATAKAAIRRNSTIDGGLIDVAEAWVTPSEFAKLPDIGMVQSAMSVASIAKGERITHVSVRKPVQIKKNDKVIVRREMGSVAIEVTAIADEDGGLGDAIRFFATDRKDRKDRKPFSAEVVGPGRAVIRGGT